MKNIRWLWIVILVALTGLGMGLRAQTPAQLLVNGNFENPRTLVPWVVTGTQGGVRVMASHEDHGQTGNHTIELGRAHGEEDHAAPSIQTDAIEQSVVIPQNTADLVLSYALKIDGEDDGAAAADSLRVSFQGEALDETLGLFVSSHQEDEWRVYTVGGLARFAGRLVTLRFEAVTHGGEESTKFDLDDVSLTYTPGSNTGVAPNLEFISPIFGCLLPGGLRSNKEAGATSDATTTGAGPLSVVADAPNGVQSFKATIDDHEVASTTDTRLTIPINWSTLTPGPHTLTATIIDPIGGIRVKRCTIASSNLLQGGDFEGDGQFAWDKTSATGTPLIQQVGTGLVVSGTAAAVLGGQPSSTFAVAQWVNIPSDAQDTLTLSFYCQTAGAGALDTGNTLSVHFFDPDTSQDYLAATVYPSYAGWTLSRTAISMASLGLCVGKDYLLRFQADTAAGSNATTFYLDDASLYVYSSFLAQGGNQGVRPATTAPATSAVVLSNTSDDWIDDAGSGNSADFITQIPATSIVTRYYCNAWEDIHASEVQPGDVLFVRTKVLNKSRTTNNMYISIGSVATNFAAPYGPTVLQKQTGVLPVGSSYWRVCDKNLGSGNVYCSSIVSGTYGVTTNFNSAFPSQMMLKSPANLVTTYGTLWAVPQWGPRACCTLGNNCDGYGMFIGAADRFQSKSRPTATTAVNYVSFKMTLSAQAISLIRNGDPSNGTPGIGAGTWKVKVAVILAGDAWTDHQNQLIDAAGHHLGMMKATLTVP